MSFIKWIRGSVDGHDQRASSKKLTLLAFIMFTGFMLIASAFFAASFPEIAWIMVISGALGTSGIQAYQAVKDHDIHSKKSVEDKLPIE